MAAKKRARRPRPKAAAKKPAAKKPAAKRPAARKPAAKKPAAKKLSRPQSPKSASSKPTAPVEVSWRKIAAWHTANGATHFALAAGATPKKLAAVEKRLGIELPEDVRASWLLHDGSAVESAWILTMGPLLSLERIVDLWETYCDWQKENDWGGEDDVPEKVVPGIRHVWWNPKRIPITDNGGDGLYLDFDPAPGGVRGQVIQMDHEVGPKAVLARSWSAFLSAWAKDLEKGRYVFDPRNAWVIDRERHMPRLERRLVSPKGDPWSIAVQGEMLTISEAFPDGGTISRGHSPGGRFPDAARRNAAAKEAFEAEVSEKLRAGYVDID